MTAAAAMVREEAFAFGCEGQTLLGILHHPAAAGGAAQAARTGVVVIVGGPQYRAGSHRQFVHLARALAAAGHPVLRFDVRGMGDSSGALHDFEQITPDIGAAIDALIERAPGVRNVVFWGLCDGASAALLYVHERADPRVVGVSIANPWVRSERLQAQTRVKHYYRDRLRSAAFWRKLLRGGIGLAAARDLGRAMRAMAGPTPAPTTADAPVHYTVRMAHAARALGPGLQIILSGRDYTAREFEEHVRADPLWQSALGRQDQSWDSLPETDHTFSSAAARQEVAILTRKWLDRSTERRA